MRHVVDSRSGSPGPGALVGLLAGVALGMLSITLLFLGMRAVMAIGGACAEGGPFVPVRPCPDGVPLAMVTAIFGLFGSAGLLIWFGSRFGNRYAALPLLGWPALFLGLGWNFLEFGLRPPGDTDDLALGWLVTGVIFVVTGAAPLLVVVAAARAAMQQRPPSAGASGPQRASTFGGPAAGWAPPVQPSPAAAPRGPAGSADTGNDITSRLERLADLRRLGDLSEAEFSAAKRRLLAEEGPDA
jgi:hypothetical protein